MTKTSFYLWGLWAGSIANLLLLYGGLNSHPYLGGFAGILSMFIIYQLIGYINAKLETAQITKDTK